MSFQLYKVRLKCLIRNRESMFWSFVFPLILATCFFFAFKNILTIESFETIKIGYVSSSQEADPLKQAIEAAKMTDDKAMFDVTLCDKAKAGELLDNDDIEAYIIGGNDPELVVKHNGLNETITKTFLDSYKRISGSIQSILTKNPQAINEGLLNDALQYQSYTKEQTKSKNPDMILIYFYSLLAFTCLYSANWGLNEVINIQADQSCRGARINVSPIHKMKLFLCNITAGFTIHCISIAILFLYMYSVLHVKFGDNLLFILITCFIGSLAGILLGATVGLYVKKKPSTKDAILSLIVLGGGFLSGMMISNMKYIIATKAPVIGYINPVNLVTDSFYSLYYYDTYDRFFLDTAILVAMIIILGAASYLGIRRKTYASI